MNKPRLDRIHKGNALVIVPNEDEETLDLFLRTDNTFRHTIPLIPVKEIIFHAAGMEG